LTKKYSIDGKHRECLGMLLVILAPLVVFSQVGGHAFLGYDDPINIFQNPRVTEGSLANLLYFWQGPALGLYIPLTYNFWLVIAKLTQLLGLSGSGEILSPILFHLANLLVHLGGTTLVYLILRELMDHGPAAIAGALLFALHPLQVEPVAWASGMKDLFSGFWSLMALWQYLRFCQEKRKPRRTTHYLLGFLALLLAMFAKPTAVMVPLLAALLGWLMLARPWRQVFIELTPWLLCVIPVVILTNRAQALAITVYQPLLWQRFLVAGDAVSFYLYKLLLPLNLGPDYGRLPELVLTQWWIYLTGTLPYLLAGVLLWKGSRPNLAAAGLFVAPLIPVLGFLPFAFQEVSTVADRYLYLAMLGPAVGLALLWQQFQKQQTCRLSVAFMLVFLAITSTLQTSCWKNSLAFSSKAIKMNPRSWYSFLRYGIAQYSANHPEEAIRAFNQALAIKPDFTDALYGLGSVYYEQGNDEQAVAMFNKVILIDQVNVPAALGLGDIYRKNGRCDLAIRYYLIAVTSELDRAEYHVSLGECYAALGRDTEAITNFQAAIATQPDYSAANSQLAAIYEKRREFDKANAILHNTRETR